jgi:hypothetical protein
MTKVSIPRLTVTIVLIELPVGTAFRLGSYVVLGSRKGKPQLSIVSTITILAFMNEKLLISE